MKTFQIDLGPGGIEAFIAVQPAEIKCPRCGSTHAIVHDCYFRKVRDVNLEQSQTICLLVILYECKECKKTFAPKIDGIGPYARYTNRAKKLARDSVIRDNLSTRKAAERFKEDFKLKTSNSTIYEWSKESYDEKIFPFSFSGVLCIDEAHSKTNGKEDRVLIAADGVKGDAILFELKENAREESIEEALKKLKEMGIEPFLIVTDFHSAYHEAIENVFPNAIHQLCHFHFMQLINKHLWKAIKKFRDRLKKEDRKEINKHRFKILKNQENRDSEEEKIVGDLLKKHKGTILEKGLVLKERIQEIFKSNNKKEAVQKIKAVLKEKHPKSLRKIIKPIKYHWKELISYMDFENVPRTNNPAEIVKRKYRAFERARYGFKSKDGKQMLIKNFQLSILIQKTKKWLEGLPT
ncbi:MAG: transposase [Euryarchaeota archaeon]|nr:transposase [Euryarchaeota archaeon]